MRVAQLPLELVDVFDGLSVGALRAALAAGLSVPGDVSITGFDDIELAGIVTPALTSVHVPHREMGRGAARILLALRNGERPETPVELEARIIHRDTLGPVPSS